MLKNKYIKSCSKSAVKQCPHIVFPLPKSSGHQTLHKYPKVVHVDQNP